MLALLFLLGAADLQHPVSSELSPDLLALVRIKQKMTQNLKDLPDFTCVESFERSRRNRETVAFERVDNLRLEVLYTGDRELYSLPGARKFDEMEPRMTGSGLFSNGEFAAHAHSVFAGNVAEIHFDGEENWRGRRALKYRFRIPVMMSGWQLKFGGVSGVVGSRGFFWADPGTYEVLRLEVSADEIPPGLPVRSATIGIEFGRLRIGVADVLAPQTAELVVTQMGGGQSRNAMAFSQCRQYYAVSEIRFGDAPAAVSTGEVQEVDLPANLILKLQLDTPIDSDKAAQGDLITAHLTAAAEAKGKVYVPQGSLVRGRIRRLERYTGDKPYLVVGLEFSEIAFGNQRSAFLGHLDHMDAIPGQIAAAAPDQQRPGSRLLSTTDRTPLSVGGMETTQQVRVVDLRDVELPGVGAFAVDGRRVRLAAGFRMTWRTISISPVNH